MPADAAGRSGESPGSSGNGGKAAMSVYVRSRTAPPGATVPSVTRPSGSLPTRTSRAARSVARRGAVPFQAAAGTAYTSPPNRPLVTTNMRPRAVSTSSASASRAPSG